VRARGAKVNIVGSDGLGSYEFLREGGSAVEGVYLTNHFSADYGGKLAKDFVEKFYEDYEVVPDAISALAYDSMMLLAKAIETAQTLDRDAVTAALANTKNFEGVSGVITIGNDHNPIKNVFVERVSELKFKFVRTITPEELEKK
jgi:branched-chain amino acid transport system substrate-binding protein